MSFLKSSKVSEFKRIRQVANVLFKHGLGYAIEQMNLKEHLPFHKRINKEAFEKPITALPVRIRQVLSSLGGTFVKFGQMMSIRHDLIPKEFCDEFAKLQDEVEPLSYKIIERVVENELGGSIKRFFKDFSKTPLASASVGQVHKARLHSGEIVAVKVQRPGIKEIFESDIKLIYRIVELLGNHFPSVNEYNLKLLVEEFESYTKKEMDYMLEARNIEIFYNNFLSSNNVKVPKVYWDFTKKRVLTMGFIEGVKISDVQDFKAMHSNVKETIDNLLNCVLDQIFDYRVFHADPHPGNILLIGHNKIALLDFGIVGRFLPDMVENIENVLIGIITQDMDLVVDSYVKMGIGKAEDFNANEFKEDLVESFGEYYGAELKQVNFATFFANSFEIARKYKIFMPLNFTLLAKSLMTLQGYCSNYAPELNLTTYLEPRVNQMMKKHSDPIYLFSSLKKFAGNLRSAAHSFPKDIGELARALKYGAKMNVEVSHKDIQNLSIEIDRSSNRIAFGLMIAAAIIATAIIILSGSHPIVYGMPLLAYIGIFFTVILCFMLFTSILKERRLKKGG